MAFLLFAAWSHYYYGTRLKNMCLEVDGKTVEEFESLVREYDFNDRRYSSRNEDKVNEWYIIIKPSLLADCTVYHDSKNITSTRFSLD